MNKAKIEQCERLCREFLERAKKVKGDNAAIGKDVWYWGSNVLFGFRRVNMVQIGTFSVKKYEPFQSTPFSRCARFWRGTWIFFYKLFALQK